MRKEIEDALNRVETLACDFISEAKNYHDNNKLFRGVELLKEAARTRREIDGAEEQTNEVPKVAAIGFTTEQPDTGTEV